MDTEAGSDIPHTLRVGQVRLPSICVTRQFPRWRLRLSITELHILPCSVPCSLSLARSLALSHVNVYICTCKYVHTPHCTTLGTYPVLAWPASPSFRGGMLLSLPGTCLCNINIHMKYTYTYTHMPGFSCLAGPPSNSDDLS